MQYQVEPSPSAIGRITLTIVDQLAIPSQEVPRVERVSYDVVLLDANSNVIKTVSGNLVPELTSAEINAIRTLVARLRTRAHQVFVLRV